MQNLRVELNENYWEVAIRCTRETRLRVLHRKILHNIYPTNILLRKMGLVDRARIATHIKYQII